jgi:hypothetical protein
MLLPVYDGFVDKCDQSSREYAVLKNGLIIRRPKGDHFERIVESSAIWTMPTNFFY